MENHRLDWNQKLTVDWLWPWRAAIDAAPDLGPGRRSGEGSASLSPFLAKELAGKIEPERQADLVDF
jgi:hypothetical protein